MQNSRITSKEFVQRWGAGLIPFPQASLEGTNISRSSFQFLTEAGLPQQPRVFFEYLDVTLLPIGTPGMGNELFLMQKVGSYQAIAATKDDWLIALYTAVQDRVVAGPRDMLERGMAALVNSSIQQFAESLLAWRTCMERADARGVTALRNRLMDTKLTHQEAYLISTDYMQQCEDLAVWLEPELRRIDAEAMSEPNNLWLNTLSYLREDTQNN